MLVDEENATITEALEDIEFALRNGATEGTFFVREKKNAGSK